MDGKDYLLQRIADHARHAILPPSDLGLLIEKVETTASKSVVQTDDRLRIGPSSVFRFKSDIDASEILDLVNAYFQVRV